MSYSKEKYIKSIADIRDHFGLKNELEVPKIEKISLNVGIKAVDSDNKFLSYLQNQLSLIAGQKAVLTRATKSIAGFKLREGSAIGCKVTLRKVKMYNFLDKLVYIALPRVRDFRGLKAKNFNQSFHYSFGIKEHSVFPDIDLDDVTKVFGMNVNIAIKAKNKEQAQFLLKKLNFPIK